ncbi:MAG: arylsulfatase [Planctomycetota bacterium]|jgi:arylsulfatase A-like enzyme
MSMNISRRYFLKKVGAVSLMVASTGIYAKSASNSSGETLPSRPNVIFILTDDQGYGDLSCHGNPILKTPNLDKLYAESTRFTDFHVAPQCLPTRGELMTGQYAFRNGTGFILSGLSDLRRGTPTIADMFKAGGYATGQFGKWHLGDNHPYRPQDRGFDETVHHSVWGVGGLGDYWDNDYFDDTYEHNGVLEKYEGYCTDVFFNEAMKWMSKQQKKNRPFFCYIPTNVPHGPFLVDEKYSKMYEDEGRFLGMITQLDENMGRMEQFLQTSGLRDNTIYIFMTDNGTSAGAHVYNAGMRGNKNAYYEGGHRVPFFFRWPAEGIDKPRDIDELASGIDILPTLLDLCGIEKPANAKFDGTSLAGLIKGEKDQLDDRMLVIQIKSLDEPGTVLWKKWRLVNGDELYKIADDLEQRNNIIEKHPDIAEKLRAYHARWVEEMKPFQGEVSVVNLGVDSEPVVHLRSGHWCVTHGNKFGVDEWEQTTGPGVKNGYWALQVMSSGQYKVELYGWPKESGLAFSDTFPSFEERNERLPGRKVAKAKLKIGEQELTTKTSPTEMSADFTVALEKGDKPRLQSWLYDSDDKDLGGAYFVYVTKSEIM